MNDDYRGDLYRIRFLDSETLHTIMQSDNIEEGELILGGVYSAILECYHPDQELLDFTILGVKNLITQVRIKKSEIDDKRIFAKCVWKCLRYPLEEMKMEKDNTQDDLMKTMAENAAKNGIPWPPIKNLGDQTQNAETPNKESEGNSSTSKKQKGAIPASVSIDIGPKYRVRIDEDDLSSIQTVKRIINSEPAISPTEMATITTQIIGMLTKNNIVPSVQINMGPHIDIVRAKPAQNIDTETKKEDKS